MNIKMKAAITAGLTLLALGMQSTQAKVTQAEADRLGTTLTRMGANPKGNAAGTIPAFTGKILGKPDWVDYKGPGNFYPNPYPDEKPLFTIDGKNWEQYKANLTDGQVAMFKKYPDTFKMPVYPTKRDTRYDNWIYENVKKNALSAELVPSGNGIRNAFGGPAFPIPKSGVELVWNHEYSPNPFFSEGDVASAAVFADKSISIRKSWESRYFSVFDRKLSYDTFGGVSARVLVKTTDPAREKGKVTLVHEFMDLTELPRNAWQYLPGTRRVRRAPTIAYDFPDGPGGLRTVDDALMFIGATDRYTWKMEPMRELYMPYNGNDIDDPALKYSDILTVNHPIVDKMRYELRRAWVVVAELQEGKRHIYSKRRLYLEEDSWAILLADNYDSQGNLWRSNMRTFVNLYDMPGMGPRLEIYHDLQKGAYLINNLVNEEGGLPDTSGEPHKEDYYTPSNLRKMGRS